MQLPFEKNFKNNNLLFFILTAIFWALFITYDYYIITKVNSLVINSKVLQSVSSDLLYRTPIVIFQTNLMYFPIALFLSSFNYGSVTKRIVMIYPITALLGEYIINNATEIFTDWLDNHYTSLFNTVFVKTVLNSPQACILVIFSVLIFFNLYLLFIRKRRIFWFSLLTMISFLTINVVYHKGVISGEFLTEIKEINREQEKIIDDFLITKNESNLNYYLKVKNWQLLTVKNNEIINIEVLNGIIDPNGQNRIKSSINNSYSDNSRISIFSRNLKIGRDETPFLAFSILENKNGFIVVDGTYFKFLFVHTDLILSSMLLAGTAFWIFLIMFIIFYHEKFLNKKRTKI